MLNQILTHYCVLHFDSRLDEDSVETHRGRLKEASAARWIEKAAFHMAASKPPHKWFDLTKPISKDVFEFAIHDCRRAISILKEKISDWTGELINNPVQWIPVVKSYQDFHTLEKAMLMGENGHAPLLHFEDINNWKIGCIVVHAILRHTINTMIEDDLPQIFQTGRGGYLKHIFKDSRKIVNKAIKQIRIALLRGEKKRKELQNMVEQLTAIQMHMADPNVEKLSHQDHKMHTATEKKMLASFGEALPRSLQGEFKACRGREAKKFFVAKEKTRNVQDLDCIEGMRAEYIAVLAMLVSISQNELQNDFIKLNV